MTQAFLGTNMTEGTLVGVVYKTGDNTLVSGVVG